MTIFYPDVSDYQAGISFSGCVIAMVKATENDNYTNPDYASAKGRAASAGAYFCAYHFLHAGNGTAQASYAFSRVGAGIPLMIDCEPTYNSNGTQKLTVDGVVGPQTWSALNLNPGGAVPYPAPTGLAAGAVSLAVSWDAVTVNGTAVASYTVQAVGLNGEVYAHETPATNSVVLTGLVAGWTYNIQVWANGSPVAPPNASLKVTV